MTAEVVDIVTGEIVETIGAEKARRLTTEAQNEFRSSKDHFEQGWAKVEEAVKGGGHVALGYRSPGDYLHVEFDGVLSGLDVAARRVAVRAMTHWGLSTRAIAPVVGTSFKTVARDVDARVSDDTPETSAAPVAEPEDAPEETEARPATVVEPNASAPGGGTPDSAFMGRVSGAREGVPRPVASIVEGGEEAASVGHSSLAPGPDVPPEPRVLADPAPRPPVTGIDGKIYNRPTSSAQPRRRPLPEAARDAGWELRKAVERLQRITGDDRFVANKDQVATHLRSHLSTAIEVCQDLLDRINDA